MSSGNGPEQVTVGDGEAIPRRAVIRGGALSVAGLLAARQLGGFSGAASALSGDAVPPNGWGGTGGGVPP